MFTSLVGSYPQPEWLIDREKLRARLPPRVRARELWRIDPAWLQDAQDAAVLAAVRDQERAGLDIVTDGEMRRESYSNRFATALDGRRHRQPGQRSWTAAATRCPCRGSPARSAGAAGRGARRGVPARGHRPPIKVTVPGPFTMAAQAQNEHYEHPREAGVRVRRRRARGGASTCSPPAPTSSSSTSRGWSRARPAREYGVEAVRARAGRRQPARPRCTSASATRCSCPTTSARTASCPSWRPRRSTMISIETAQAKLDVDVLDPAAGQDDRARRDRARRDDGRDPGGRRRADRARAALHGATSSPRPTAG